MHFHRNAKLGLAGRRELVLAIAGGSSMREAAQAFHVSVATADRWSKRWRQASTAERRSLSCLFDRSSRLPQYATGTKMTSLTPAELKTHKLRVRSFSSLGSRCHEH
jgi:helix-turn-helix protein